MGLSVYGMQQRTGKLENTLNYGLERVWAVGYMKSSRRVVFGYDEGTIMVKIGREIPVVSMDNSGKIVWAKHNEIQMADIRRLQAGYEATDRERLTLCVKDLGNCDFYPQYLKHNPNGRFVVACGDGEYIIYTPQKWRNKSFGSALEFVWSSDGEYTVRESTSKIKICNRNFEEKKSIRPTFSAERIYGGVLLAMCSNDFICFYDWAESDSLGESMLMSKIFIGPIVVTWWLLRAICHFTCSNTIGSVCLLF
ncbi:hypothetical protein Droror1_Dr00009955 [Drosera rotundifolia]